MYFLLRQVGLRQPEGWWGPARNLIKKLFIQKLINICIQDSSKSTCICISSQAFERKDFDDGFE